MRMRSETRVIVSNVWSCGSASHGQLGHGDGSRVCLRPHVIVEIHALKRDGTLHDLHRAAVPRVWVGRDELYVSNDDFFIYGIRDADV